MSQIQKEYAGDNDAYKKPVLRLNREGTITYVMTGQEWYDRFRAEVTRSLDTYDAPRVIDDVLAAARRAANLTDKETDQ